MIIPLCVVIIMLTILLLCPFLLIFHPEKADNLYAIKSTDSYVNVTADILHYSGYNLIKTGQKEYGYYYGLKDDHCVFVIIPVDKTPKTELKNYSFKGKIIRPNSTYREMLSAFSKDLNWNENSLKKITGNFVISNADYHPVRYMILLWCVLIIFLIALKKLLGNIAGYLNPYLYPVCTFLGKKEQKAFIDDAQYELNSENFLQINSMYITENYFIDLGKTKVSIIPLNEIVWCYRLGESRQKGRNHSPEYALCFTILSGSVIMAKHKTSDEALEVINAIRATEYDIIIGHSESKRREAKKIINRYKKLQ